MQDLLFISDVVMNDDLASDDSIWYYFPFFLFWPIKNQEADFLLGSFQAQFFISVIYESCMKG